MKAGQFISLKWKAFALTSLVLILVLAFVLASTQHLLERLYHFQRNQLHNEYDREISLILEQRKQQLTNLSQSILSYQGVLEAFLSEKESQIHYMFNEHWWPLQINSGLQNAVFYNKDSSPIATWGEPTINLALVAKSNAEGSTHSYLHCDQFCSMYLTAPLFIEGRQIGVILLGASLSQQLIHFRNRMNVDIGILAETHPDKFHHRIDSWGVTSLAITHPDKNIELLKAASLGTNFADLKRRSFIKQHRENTFELTIKLNTELSGLHNVYWLFISDVSELIQLQRSSLITIMLISVLALGLCGGLLLLLLWGPLTRLRKITRYLPRLTSNYQDLIDDFGNQRRTKKWFQDESDIVSYTSIHLAKRLRLLNNKVNARTQALESYAEELNYEKEFVAKIINTAQALILTLDEEGHIQLFNQHAQWLTGYKEHDVLGQPFQCLFAKQLEYLAAKDSLLQIISGVSHHTHHHSDLKTQSGEYIHMAWYHSSLNAERGDKHRIITVALDISERKRVEEHLGWLASHDPLTNIYNRRRFSEEMEQVIATSHRYGHTSALLYFDLDNFKDVNDLSGHHAGDELLTKVSDELKKVARESDILARLGGDEFAVILKETNKADALISAQRFCKALNSIQIHVGHNKHQVSASIGAALYPQHGMDLKTLLANADTAMYRAKQQGRNRVCFYSESDDNVEELEQRIFWSQKAKDMITHRQVLMYYQPIWNISQRRISHYEALLRIQDGERLLAPFELIQMAERTNMIFELDQLILDQVLQDLARLEEKGISPHFNINVSGLSFQNPKLVTNICDLVMSRQVNPHQITCEITETAAVADVGVTSQVMSQLKELGVKIALDDFGVGFSSIYYLKHFPIDFIKIDGSFIKNIHTDKDGQTLVKAIVEVAKAFGQQTVAEFVETKAALDIITELGVDYAQGYYFQRPMPLEEAFKHQLDGDE